MKKHPPSQLLRQVLDAPAKIPENQPLVDELASSVDRKALVICELHGIYNSLIALLRLELKLVRKLRWLGKLLRMKLIRFFIKAAL
ncbi:hypothetical protein PsorP6_008295 [Peronosclerospora sorghi]|uniref:Uncharacterized protein n=1 Tax=Peronosclerospora sorghi TaxID=230839 RepID=A0ACC0WA85_9STRA|nr:hypothetical protein PsorP6_008295 [Peronosclerospora sorghi]